MGWYKIDISAEQAANNETANIQDQADEIWSMLRYLKGFALFHSRDSVFPASIYFSPLASEYCKSIIEKYNGAACSAPAQEEVSFLLGHDEDKLLI